MKKTLTIFGLALLVAACSNNKTGNNSSDTSSTVASSTSNIPVASAAADSLGAALLAKNDCLTCHRIQEKLIGPAYMDVAKKYSPATPAIVDTLANKVIRGGSGNWGQVPMAPHPTLSVTDARTIVTYILSLNKTK